MFKHVVITRFNVATNGVAPSQDWLSARIDLFKKFTLPSMLSQSQKNFTWLVFFDINTSQQVISDLNRKNIFVPILTREFNTPFIKSTILNHLPQAEHIISTRLDNDDALADTFIEEVQKQFSEQDCQFINFSGYIFHKNHLHFMRLRSNPFISMIEKWDANFKTVMSEKHYKLNLVGEILNIDKPLWLQVIHKNNLVNQVRGTHRHIHEITRFKCSWTEEDLSHFKTQNKIDNQLVRAMSKLKENQPSVCQESLKELLPKSPNDFNLLHIYGISCLMAGDTKLASEYFHKALETHPFDYECRINLAFTYLIQENKDAAMRTIEAGLQYFNEDNLVKSLLECAEENRPIFPDISRKEYA